MRIPAGALLACVAVIALALAAFERSPHRVLADPSLIAYWRFDDGSGLTASDSSGNGYDGTIVGPSWATGYAGSALSFDGIDDSVLVPDLPISNGATAAEWVEFAPNGYGTYFYQGGAGEWGMGRTTSVLEFAVKLSDGGWYRAQSTDAISSGWHHIAGTWSRDGDVRLYVDGVLKTSTGVPDLALFTACSSSIGSYCGGLDSFFSGRLDEVKVWNRALSGAEIASEVGAPTPTPTITPTWTPTGTPTPSPTPPSTSTSTPTKTNTPTPTNSPTPTITPTATNSPTPTQTPICGPTPVASGTHISFPSEGAVHAKVVSRDAADTHAFELDEPVPRIVIAAPDAVGKTGEVGRVCAHAELVFGLRGSHDGTDYYYLSTNSSRAHVDQLGATRWKISWEDGNPVPDNDFDDTVEEVYQDIPVAVGGIAEAPDRSALPAANARPSSRSPWLSGAAVPALALALISLVVWRRRRYR